MLTASRRAVILTLLAASLIPAIYEAPAAPPVFGGRPNILLIVSDDQSSTIFSRELMPTVHEQLVDKGVLFTRAYVNTSLCCPSRAEILTGLYQHHTWVDSNGGDLARPTFVQALHDGGYRTMLAGKYLNSYGCDPPLREFDQWVCVVADPYHDPVLNVNGTAVRIDGYGTDILADHVVDFIDATPKNQPFFAMYTPKSPHLPADDDRCADLPVTPHRPPSFDEDPAAGGKPLHMHRPPFTEQEIQAIDHNHQIMTQAVACLDPSVGTILDGLGPRADRTFVLYLSDNGYLYGEHRATDKLLPYEESVRVPFVVRYPALVPEDEIFVSDALVQTVDIAPTFADLAGVPWNADGRSLLPLLAGQLDSIRTGALVEHCQAEFFPCIGLPSFNGIATGRYKYVEYQTEETELYDLVDDPFEMANLAGEPGWDDVEAELSRILARLRAPPAIETTIVSGPGNRSETATPTFVYFSQSRFATYACRLTENGRPGPWLTCGGSAVTLGPLAPAHFAFEVRGTDEHGVTDATPALRSFSVRPARQVRVVDYSMVPSAAENSQGGVVKWLFQGPSDHTVTDASGMELFDSGSVSPGGSYAFAFIGAGTYPYRCTIHPAMEGTIDVPLALWPRGGNVSTKLVLTLGSLDPEPGFGFDVQVARPGGGWESWMEGVTESQASFTPDHGPGTYAFRARLRNLATGAALDYSPPTTVVVVANP
jgi:N-acetylglucosamine-6-sulfatase